MKGPGGSLVSGRPFVCGGNSLSSSLAILEPVTGLCAVVLHITAQTEGSGSLFVSITDYGYPIYQWTTSGSGFQTNQQAGFWVIPMEDGITATPESGTFSLNVTGLWVPANTIPVV